MTQANILAQLGSTSGPTFRNRIINGAMVIDQRNAGASVSNINGIVYSVDRWLTQGSVASKFTAQQNAGSVTPPVGFANYLGITSSSAYSVSSGDYFSIGQKIEGYNIADLGWGTANAKTITVSFWVYSSLTGTFGAVIQNNTVNRTYPFTYSIPVANTWTQISVPVAGDTAGTWATTNSSGIFLQFGLGVGSTYSGTAGSWSSNNYVSATGATSVVGTNGATFYITGVQLEVGSSATGYEYRMYGQELALCQRYCPVFNMGSSSTNDLYRGFAVNTTLSDYSLALPVTVRTPPTGITTSGTFGVGNGAAGANATAVAFLGGGYDTLNVRATTTAGSPVLAQGVGTAFYGSSNGVIIATGCEL